MGGVLLGAIAHPALMEHAQDDGCDCDECECCHGIYDCFRDWAQTLLALPEFIKLVGFGSPLRSSLAAASRSSTAPGLRRLGRAVRQVSAAR